MSAFMCDFGHIDFLVKAVRAFDIRLAYIPAAEGPGLDHVDLRSLSNTELGRLLVGTNLTSMIARYGDGLDESERSMPERYTYRSSSEPLDPVQILKAVACYEYQCCEYDGWSKSLAHDLLQRVQAYAISALPGYASAQWEISRPREGV